VIYGGPPEAAYLRNKREKKVLEAHGSEVIETEEASGRFYGQRFFRGPGEAASQTAKGPSKFPLSKQRTRRVNEIREGAEKKRRRQEVLTLDGEEGEGSVVREESKANRLEGRPCTSGKI